MSADVIGLVPMNDAVQRVEHHSVRMTTWGRLRFWLIKTIAGRSSILLNVVVEGRAFSSGRGSLVAGCNFHRCGCRWENGMYVGMDPDPTNEKDIVLQGRMLRHIS